MEFPVVAADLNDCELNLYSVSLVLLLNIQKYLREKAKSYLQQYIISSVKLHWYLGILHFILRLRLYKLNTLSLLSAAAANSKVVCYIVTNRAMLSHAIL